MGPLLPRASVALAVLGCAITACGSHAEPPPTSAGPVPTERVLTPTPRAATTYFRSCVITGDDDHVLCWGLRFGPATEEGDPAGIGSWIVRGLEHALEVDIATSGVCARVEGGAVRCALAPEDGALTDAITVGALEGATSIAMLTSGDVAWLCGAMPDGTLRCAVDPRGEPHVVTPVHADDVLQVRRVDRNVCLLRRDADVTCFSSNEDSVVSFAGTHDAIAVGPGPCFVSASGAVRCCGYMSADAPCHDEPTLGPAIAVAADTWGGWRLAVGRDGTARAIHGGDEIEDSPVAHFDARDLVGLVSEESTCFVHRSGELSCFGPSHYGQLDVQVASPPGVPTQVIGAHDVVDLVADDAQVLALGADGTIFTWSRATDRASAHHVAPVLVELAGARYGRDAEGHVYELRAPMTGSDVVATRVDGLDAGRGLVGGLGDRLCAVDGDGAVSCLGRTPEIGPALATPHRMPSLDGLTSLAVVRTRACGLLDGRVRCADIDHPDEPATEIAGARGVVRVLGGHHQWLFVRGDGSVLVRDDEPPSLGGPASDPSAPPRRGPWAEVIGATFSEGQTCAWRASGPLMCAGIRAPLQPSATSDGPAAPELVPVPSITDVRALALAAASCAALSDGTVWCWGRGARGDGHRLEARAPIAVPIARMTPN